MTVPPTDPAILLTELAARRLLPEAQLRGIWERLVPIYLTCRHEVGVPCLEHVCGTLEVLESFEPDVDLVLAVLAQHLPQHEGWTPQRLAATFGRAATELVGNIRLLSHLHESSQRMSIEHLRDAFLAGAEDPRVILAVLCGRLFLLRQERGLASEARLSLARDAIRLDAPVAARLGIYSLKHQLEAVAFPIVYPTDSERIVDQLLQLTERHGAFLEQASRSLQASLRGHGLNARVEHRQKLPYSIFLKMREKTVSDLRHIYDLFALRVVVPDSGDCYQVLGWLHQLGHPVQHRFKDYIAFPKPNGYQSLHSTLTRLPGIPEGLFVEVQIRTAAMHREAELGIAAHWNYKERGLAAARRAAFQHLLSDQQASGPTHTLRDHIFVMTPRGDVLELPKGATPLDFAFQVHTTLGLTYRGARVNGEMVAMDHVLDNGDVVEVIRGADAHPSPRWMHLLRTASARSRLRKALQERDRSQHLELGRLMLNDELKRRGVPRLDPDLTLLARLLGEPADRAHREDLLVHLGQGGMKLAQAVTAIDALDERRPKSTTPEVALPREVAWAVTIDAEVPLRHRLAKCCQPTPKRHRQLVGVVSRRGEVVVHASTCRLLKGADVRRQVGARWQAPAPAAKAGKRVKKVKAS
jgi:GTP pyrophosphokinase